MNVTVTWTGKSGQNYEFETYPVGTQFNHVSGVYIACKRLYTGHFEALYVGESQSLYDRINSSSRTHNGLKCASFRGMTHIGAIVIPSNSERLRVETDLRHGLNPSCNMQNVPNKHSISFG